MDTDTASHFVSSLVQSIQALCHGYVQFSSSIEVIGHIYLNVDKGLKFNYVVNEEVSKEPNENMTVFHTNSYHSVPPSQLDTHQCKSCAAKSDFQNTALPVMAASKNLDDSLVKSGKSKAKTSVTHTYSKDQRISIQNHLPGEGVMALEATASSTPTQKRRKKRVWPKSVFSQVEPSISNLNPVVVIKREPDVESGDRNMNNGEEHTSREQTLQSETCEDAVKIEDSDPYPVTIHRNLEDSAIGKFACDVTAFQSGSGNGGLLSLPIPSSLENSLHAAQEDIFKTVKSEDVSSMPPSCQASRDIDVHQFLYQNNFKLTDNLWQHPQQISQARATMSRRRTSNHSPQLLPQLSVLTNSRRSKARYNFMSDEERKAYNREQTRLRVAAYRLRQKNRRLEMSHSYLQDSYLPRFDSSKHRRSGPQRQNIKKEIDSLSS